MNEGSPSSSSSIKSSPSSDEFSATAILLYRKFCMIAGRPEAVIYNFPTDHFANFGRLICPNLPDRKTWADFTRLATTFCSSLLAGVYPLVWGPCGPACLSADQANVQIHRAEKSGQAAQCLIQFAQNSARIKSPHLMQKD